MAVITSRGSTDSKQTRSFLGRRGRDLALNVGLLGVLYIAYSLARGVTANELSRAMANASDLLHIQDLLGLPSELSLQQDFLPQTGLLKAANVYYLAIHFPITIAFMSWVWLRHRDRFDRIRNTLIGVTIAGLVLHILYPLAPPRMLGGFVDTAATIGPNPYDLGIAEAANQIAAMPSLHVGWAMLVAVGIIWITRNAWSYLALTHPLITAVVVVLTANHYWSDVIVAVALVMFGWLIFRGSLRKQTVEVESGQPQPPKPAEPVLTSQSR